MYDLTTLHALNASAAERHREMNAKGDEIDRYIRERVESQHAAAYHELFPCDRDFEVAA